MDLTMTDRLREKLLGDIDRFEHAWVDANDLTLAFLISRKAANEYNENLERCYSRMKEASASFQNRMVARFPDDWAGGVTIRIAGRTVSGHASIDAWAGRGRDPGWYDRVSAAALDSFGPTAGVLGSLGLMLRMFAQGGAHRRGLDAMLKRRRERVLCQIHELRRELRHMPLEELQALILSQEERGR